MIPGVVAHFEFWILGQQESLFGVGAHPIAAHEEGGRDLVFQQNVNDPLVKPGRIFWFLAYVKGQGNVGF